MPEVLPYSGYCKLEGRLLLSVADTNLDPDKYPDGVLASGTITITPSVKPFIRFPAEGVAVVPKPITLTLNASGYITANGDTEIYIPPTDDPAGSPTDWTWMASFDVHGPDEVDLNITPYSFSAPMGETIDLFYVAPIASGGGTITTQGPSGLSAYELAVGNGYTGTEEEWLRNAQPVEVTQFTTPGTNQPYTIPAGAKLLRIRTLAAGAGGGSGRRGAAATIRCGGGGGGGGGYAEWDVSVSDLGGLTTLYCDVGAGGVGGAAVTADNTNGNNGTVGGGSTVKTASGGISVATGISQGGGGNFGSGGTASSGLAGASAAGKSFGVAGIAASTTGGTGGNGGGTAGGVSGSAAPGGGISSSDTPSNGGNGGYMGGRSTPAATGGVAPGGAGTNGANPPALVLGAGQGGAGGASSITGAAGAGGNGGRGGAGGGGGASLNGNNSGKGGDGGNGFVEIVAIF